MLALCKLVDVSVCAGQAAARKAQPLWQQLGFQAKIYERKKTEEPHLLLARTRELTVFMENFQNGYGFFLLVDLTLMLLYWLIHTFKAYFTFQASVIRKSENRMPDCSGALKIPCPLCWSSWPSSPESSWSATSAQCELTQKLNYVALPLFQYRKEKTTNQFVALFSFRYWTNPPVQI